jgi:hypothetical protein
MSELKTSPLVWAKDEQGERYLCPFDALGDPNTVADTEKAACIDDDSRLDTRRFAPSNTMEGKRHFPKSVSLN